MVAKGDNRQAPAVRPDSRDVVQAGMVVTIEPGIYLPGWGGVRLEDDRIRPRFGLLRQGDRGAGGVGLLRPLLLERDRDDLGAVARLSVRVPGSVAGLGDCEVYGSGGEAGVGERGCGRLRDLTSVAVDAVAGDPGGIRGRAPGEQRAEDPDGDGAYVQLPTQRCSLPSRDPGRPLTG